MVDEPVLDKNFNQTTDNNETPVVKSIRNLVQQSPYAILCSQINGQPYGSLLAYSASEDLGSIYFATPKSTRKYNILSSEDRVSFVIDNRHLENFNHMSISAVTITGIAREVKELTAKQEYSAILLKKHPFLKELLHAQSAALFEIETHRFLFVERFQEVKEWVIEK